MKSGMTHVMNGSAFEFGLLVLSPFKETRKSAALNIIHKTRRRVWANAKGFSVVGRKQ